jgi:hypothetical protein
VTGGWPKTPEKQKITHPAPAQAFAWPIRRRLDWGTVCGSPPCSPYSELGLVLPSKTPAKREGVYTFAFAAAAKRKFV